MAYKMEMLEEMKRVLELEADAITQLSGQLNDDYYKALEIISYSTGRVICTGIGKSGLIARKIAATLTSTGTSSMFLHPSDALHGDLGSLTGDDVVLAIGKSGESDELVDLLPHLKSIGVKIIGLTGNLKSTLAKNSDVVLYAPVEKEACPHDLAPTVSTTLALAVGDALAVALMKMKNFKGEDFAFYHPGGKLGKRLRLRIADLMIQLENCSMLNPESAKLADAITALARHGIVLFSMNGSTLEGILTDGDLRRLLDQHREKIFGIRMTEVMNKKPLTLTSETLAVEALKFMEARERALNVVPIVDEGRLKGLLRLHELLSLS